jgi:hypothetical protein
MPRARSLNLDTAMGEAVMTVGFARIRLAAVALVFATVPLAGHGARAFTINTESATNADGTARYADPDDEVNNFGRNGFQFGQSGGPSVQFGVQGGANWQEPFGPRSFGGRNNE